MKRKRLYQGLAAVAACLTMGACDFLDVVPQSSATIDDIYKTQNQAEQMVLTCYKEIPNYYHPQQFPDWTAGNDFVTGWYGSVRYFHWKSLAYGQESATSTYYSLWSNSAANYPTGYVSKLVWEGVRYCYNVLNNIDRVPDITPEYLNYFKGEALFLIGYYHQIMLEYYGPIVLVKGEMSANATPAEMNVPRSTYDECVNFIADKYEQAAQLLPARWSDTGHFNRATAAAALAFRARLLLYAASPLYNGADIYKGQMKNLYGDYLFPQQEDPEKWQKAADAAYEVIKMNKYDLIRDNSVVANGTTITDEDAKFLNAMRSYQLVWQSNTWTEETIWGWWWRTSNAYTNATTGYDYMGGVGGTMIPALPPNFGFYAGFGGSAPSLKLIDTYPMWSTGRYPVKGYEGVNDMS